MRIRFKRKKTPAERPDWMNKLVARERALRWRIAERLGKRTARLSPMQLRWLAVLSLSIGMAAYTWIGVRAITMPRTAGKILIHVDTLRRSESLYRRHGAK